MGLQICNILKKCKYLGSWSTAAWGFREAAGLFGFSALLGGAVVRLRMTQPKMKFQDARADSDSVSLAVSQMLTRSTGFDGSALQNGLAIDTKSGRDLLHSTPSGSNEGRMATEVATECHPDGCHACVFAGSQLGCPRGDLCPFCHNGHPVTLRRKGLRRGQRERITRRILTLFRGQNLIEVHDAQLTLKNFSFLLFQSKQTVSRTQVSFDFGVPPPKLFAASLDFIN